MHPVNVSEFQKARQGELLGAADSWRSSHPCGMPSLRQRLGARLIAVGVRLSGNARSGGR